VGQAGQARFRFAHLGLSYGSGRNAYTEPPIATTQLGDGREKTPVTHIENQGWDIEVGENESF
jgi:hypothetical protein